MLHPLRTAFRSLLLLLEVGIASMVFANVTLPPILSNHMVLQQQKPLPIWGTAEAGESVTVSFAGQTCHTTADAAGQWLVHLKPLRATADQRAQSMTIRGNNCITITDVMIGEVWVCSGQSNMELTVMTARHDDAEIAAADYPQIRLLSPERTPMLAPRSDSSGSWMVCESATVPDFSAVAYYFGRELYRRLHLPIGLISASVGGTSIEQWMSRAALADVPALAPQVATLDAKLHDLPRQSAEDAAERAAWLQKIDAIDPGMQEHWYAPETATPAWKTMDLPRYWDGELAGLDGVAWYRRDVEVPAEMAGRPLDLALGPVDDMDITWVNGVQVGSIMEMNNYTVPRLYHLPAGLVHAGRNTVVVRVLNLLYGGGLPGYRTEMRLLTQDTSRQQISLAGPWQYHIGFNLKDVPLMPYKFSSHFTDLYNGMIAPLTHYPIGGVIWYQGEANTGAPALYTLELTAMIRRWREAWHTGAFPFLIVQLPNLGGVTPEPAESALATFREAQQRVLAEPGTGMIVTIDIGDPQSLHPLNKQDVGLRLALLAARQVYGQRLDASGPIMRGVNFLGDKARVRFTSFGGLTTRDKGALTGFAIAGSDKTFVWATAVIDGDNVLVSSPRVPHPVAVRYAWADSPVCNLINPAGLPATPFRSDTW